jgi:hypothetical protein
LCFGLAVVGVAAMVVLFIGPLLSLAMIVLMVATMGPVILASIDCWSPAERSRRHRPC